MNGSTPFSPSGSFQATRPKRRRRGLRVPCSPSPQPSPPGEGETFARALILRSSSVVVNLRNERRRSGDRSRKVRIFQYCANALPLLGERAGVRENEANSDSSRRTIPSCGRAGDFPIWL
jgi:hypothetical protein